MLDLFHWRSLGLGKKTLDFCLRRKFVVVLSLRNTKIGEEQWLSGLVLSSSVVQDTPGSTDGGSKGLQVFISEILWPKPQSTIHASLCLQFTYKIVIPIQTLLPLIYIDNISGRDKLELYLKFGIQILYLYVLLSNHGRSKWWLMKSNTFVNGPTKLLSSTKKLY